MKERKAQKLAHSELPKDPSALASLVEEEGRLLRLRSIARLDNRGYEPPEIARELSKGGTEWQLEAVLFYMGLGQEGTAKDREDRQRQYEIVREETKHPELIDIDRQLAEMQSTALRILKEALETASTPDQQAKIAQAVLKISGIGADRLERKIVEIRMPQDVYDGLQRLVGWRAPKDQLSALIESVDEGENLQ